MHTFFKCKKKSIHLKILIDRNIIYQCHSTTVSYKCLFIAVLKNYIYKYIKKMVLKDMST